MPVKKKPGRIRNNVRTLIIILLIMGAMVATAIIIGGRVANVAPSTVDVALPLIVTPLTDPATGTEYNVQTLFTVRLNSAVRRDVSDSELEEELKAIMLEMDISKLLDVGRVQYLSDRATELLKDRLAAADVDTQVLVVDFATDDRVKLNDPENQSNRVMDGLFQNVN